MTDFDSREQEFAATIAEETVCYTSLTNTKACVIVPEDAPQEDIDFVMNGSRMCGLVCSRVHQLDGDAFAFEMDFAKAEVVDVAGPEEAMADA